MMHEPPMWRFDDGRISCPTEPAVGTAETPGAGLAPLPHAQWVFAIPRALRGLFEVETRARS